MSTADAANMMQHTANIAATLYAVWCILMLVIAATRMVLEHLTPGLMTALRHQLERQVAGCCVCHGVGLAEKQVVYLSRIAP